MTGDWEALFELSLWLLKLDWPSAYPKLGAAFEQYRRALVALLEHLSRTVEHEDGWYKIEKPHAHIDWNPPLYTELMSAFNVNAHVVWLLTVDSTRALNLVIAAIIDELDPLYRFDYGLALMSNGDIVSGQTLMRLEYERVVSSELPRRYDSHALLERVRSELDGGDPRAARALNPYHADVATWAHR